MVYDFGLILKGLREKKNMSQEYVGSKIGVTRSNISAYERNIKMPSMDSFVKLALLYNVSTDYLLGLEKKKTVVLSAELTESQQEVLENVVDRLQKEFLRKNKVK